MIKDILEANDNVTPNQKELGVLKQNFPSCFKADGSFDITRFSEFLKDKVNITHEGYELKFLGKSYAKLLASLDTETVIVPDEDHNSLPENKNSQNIYISGDNLDALKHLLKSYSGKVKCIYIDPPYNTGSDGFVYKDKFEFKADELARKLSIGQEQAEKILDLTSKGSASHSAWMTFMYPRLQLAREMLTEDGVIFISIDDNEQANLKLICDEVFGEENFIANIPYRKRTAKSDVPCGISQDYESILCYVESSVFKAAIDGSPRRYFETPDFPGRPWRIHDMTNQRTASERPNSFFTMINPKTGEEYPCDPNRTWRVTKDTFQTYYEKHEIVFPGDYDFLNISKPQARYFKDKDMEKDGIAFGKIAVSTKLPKEVGMNSDGTSEIKKLFDDHLVFSFPKPVSLLKFFIKILNVKQGIILDFFSGSGTTAQAVMEDNDELDSNFNYIMVQLPEQIKEDKEAFKLGYRTIDQIGMDRIKRAANQIRKEHPDTKVDLGFKHYTLKEIEEKNLLDRIYDFTPDAIIPDTSISDSIGLNTILTTWLVSDGYGFNNSCKALELDNYTAYHCDNHLYLINSGLSNEAVKQLMDKYSNDAEFSPQNVVIFGYNFNYVQTENLKTNFKILKDTEKNLKINLQIRY